jgi:hypothetical protein
MRRIFLITYPYRFDYPYVSDSSTMYDRLRSSDDDSSDN